ncbi:hypothetical protein [Mycobacteroides abscessus]|uniref:hypothetical protein n=1 Tax=Mycobacteroides abscessus TaxID=36809 RepID=UPI001F16B410|nr:hypothetical protein [Mycobacteroides abscessus]
MTAPLNPTEALRKVAHDALDEAIDQLVTLVGVGVSIPEGPPVGTIARRPDGEWLAERKVSQSTDAGWWNYLKLGYPSTEEPPEHNGADSWPVIFAPGEAVGSGPTTDGGETYDPTLEKTREEKIQDYMEWSETQINTDALDPTAQQEPPKGLYGKYRVERVDGKPIRACFVLEYLDDLHANKALLEYAFSVERVNPELAKDLRTEWGKWPGRSQQEPGESLSRGLDDLAAGRVSRRDDYLEPEDPEYCGNCDGRKCMGCVFREYDHDCADDCPDCCTTARTPRVVDRLGVDEQGSRWHGAEGAAVYFHSGESWRTNQGNAFAAGYQPNWDAPYTEILEPQPEAEGESSPKSSPRVLPSLDCEEARDGTVWEARNGWRFWFNGEWRTDNGTRGMDIELSVPRLLRSKSPYTEVLPDVG